jgi:uncharacterized protein
MKADLMEVLCCPICQGDLALAVTHQAEQEIEEGTLTCKGCATVFPIHEGIPDLLPPDER